nr:hypothetical protein PanWU01x14_165220 [Ipomoea trifida]
MASSNKNITISTTSPKGATGESNTVPAKSPKGQCLCSPTTHKGSFRCRYHRSDSSGSSAWFKRSNSLPPGKSHNLPALSPKSVEST